MAFDPSLFTPTETKPTKDDFDPAQFVPAGATRVNHPDDQALVDSTDVAFGLNPANPVGEAALKIIDTPVKYLVRKPLEYLHEKAIEPSRVRTEQEWANAPEEIRGAIPEAFAPLPSKEVFVPAMEAAITMGAPTIGAIDKLSKISKLSEVSAAAGEALGKLTGDIPYELGAEASNVVKAGTPTTEAEALRAAPSPGEVSSPLPPPEVASSVEVPALSALDSSPPKLNVTIKDLAPQGTDVGSIRPITFGDTEVGFKARVLDKDTGLYQEKYLTNDGKVAQGIVPTQDEFGAHLDFVGQDGAVVARTTANTPADVMKLGQASRLSAFELDEGGTAATFTAQDFSSGKPTLVIVKPGEGAITTSGPGYKPTTDSPIISPEVDPSLRVTGLSGDVESEVVANKIFKDLTMNEVGPGYEGKGVPPPVPSLTLPQLSEDIMPIAKVPGIDLNKWTGGLMSPGSTISPRDLMGFLNPPTYFRTYFGNDNPFIDGLRQVLRTLTMRADAVQWKRELLQGVDRATDVIHQEWTPIWAQFRETTAAIRGDMLSARYEMNRATDPAVKAAYKTALDNSTLEYQLAWSNHAPKYYEIMNRLAKDNPDVRIAFLVEPQKGVNVPNVTEAEQRIAQQVGDFFEKYKAAAKEQGLSVKEGAYMHRPYVGRGVDVDPVIKDMLEGTKPVFSRPEYANLSETDFMSRVPGVPNMHPSVQASLDSYIKSAPNKIAQRAWENKWNDTLNGSDPRIRDYAQGFHDNVWGARTQNWLDPWVDITRGAMYLRGVGFSALTASKHLFGKMYLTSAELGYGQTAAALPKTMEMLIGNEPNLQRAKSFWLSSKWVFQDIFDSPQVNEGMGSKALQLIEATKKASMQPTGAVELLENGLSFVGGMMKAHGLDFDHEQTMNALLHLASRANFRGGVGHAPWMGSTMGKMGSIFSWTPMNIAENLAYTQYEAGKNIVNLLQGKSQAQTAFGENWIWVAYRQLAFWGTAELAARSQGKSLTDLLFHVPYMTGNAFANMYTDVTKSAWHEKEKAQGLMKDPMMVYGAAKGFGQYWFKQFAAWKQAKALMGGEYDKNKFASPVESVLGVERAPGTGQYNPMK